MENIKKSKMGSMPVNKLMLSMGIPMILSMVLQAVYNIVDSAFVSNMTSGGEEAINALTLAFPVQMLMVAISIGTGVGANALLSKSLGQKNEKRVNMTAGNALFLGIVIYAAFLVFGFVGVEGYISTQTVNPVIKNMACEYLGICCVYSVGIVLFSVYEKLLQATGRSLFSTIAQVAGAVVNIVLDPIMIYGWLGMPEMGVKGAAFATVIGQCVSFVFAFIFHLIKNKEITNSIKYVKPSGEIIKDIYIIGLPAIIAQALMSVMTYAMNVILLGIGENVVTAYGLYYKIQQFVLFAAFGLRDAITPIVSFSHGMCDKERIKKGIKCGVKYTVIIMIIGTAAIEILAAPLSGIFGLTGSTMEICVGAMRIVSLSFVFAGINIALQGVFQALDSGIESLIVSVGRQLVFVIPTALFFRNLVLNAGQSVSLVWWTFIIAEGVTAVIAFFVMKRTYKRKVDIL